MPSEKIPSAMIYTVRQYIENNIGTCQFVTRNGSPHTRDICKRLLEQSFGAYDFLRTFLYSHYNDEVAGLDNQWETKWMPELKALVERAKD